MEENNEITVEPSDTAAKTYLQLCIGLLIISACSTVFQYLFIIVYRLLQKAGTVSADGSIMLWVLTFIPIYVIAIPLGLLYMRKVPNGRKKISRLTAKEFLTFLLVCVPMMYVGNIIGTLLAQLVTNGTAQNGLDTYAQQTGIIKVLIIVIVGPFIEEYVFRKTLIDKTRDFGGKQAVIFSAVAFALYHMNLYQIFYAFGLGLIFGYVYLRTGKIIYSYIMHMAVNFTGSVLAPWIAGNYDADAYAKAAAAGDMEKLMKLIPGMLGTMVYSLLLIGLSIAGVIVFANKIRKLQFEEAEFEIQKKDRIKTIYLNVGFILFAAVCIAMTVLNLIV